MMSDLRPPFFWHRYGNLQRLPKPTAKPTLANRYSALFPQLSRVGSTTSTSSLSRCGSALSPSALLLAIAVRVVTVIGKTLNQFS
jgi:hypothetical protein